MKAILEFNLDDPEDRMAHFRCIKASEMASALFEIVYNANRYVVDVDQYQERINEAVKDLNIDELIS